MQKNSSSPIPTILLGSFWFILTINTTFNWGSNATLFFWLVCTILVGWFLISIQGKTHRI